MEPVTIILGIAIVAVIAACILALTGSGKTDLDTVRESQKNWAAQESAAPMPAAHGSGAVPVPQGARKQRNKKGWRAPTGHYFNDADELVDDLGNLILDLMIIAELCNEPYDGGAVTEPIETVVSEYPASESVTSEPVAASVSGGYGGGSSDYSSDGGGGGDCGGGGGDCGD